MHINLSFSLASLSVKNLRAHRALPVSIRRLQGNDAARFYYTTMGELRMQLDSGIHAWKNIAKDQRNRAVWAWQQIK